jgi:DinB superfamily
MHQNPYADDLGTADPLTALAETPERIRVLVDGWSVTEWERSYAPGKWTARQVIVHLAQTELALTTRVRFAASQEGYVAQGFAQDDWLPLDDQADARTALGAYMALRKLNVLMFQNLTAAQRTRPFRHPEYGELTPEWVAAQMAGHDIHHLKQLQTIKSA